MRVCVTGGLGFIGNRVVRALARRGHPVLCIDDLRGEYAAGTGPEAARVLGTLPDVEVVRADLRSAPLESLLEDVGAVVHLAALPGVRSHHPLGELWEHNVVATERVLRAATPARARVVLASSSSVYGEAVRRPTAEHAPPSPLNFYAVSKLAAEHACRAAAREGADAVVARLFTVFGPGQRPDMAIAGWIERTRSGLPLPWHVHRHGRRELTYVDDAVRGLLATLDNGRPGQAYNVAGCGSVALEDVVRLIERELGRDAALLPQPSSGAEAVATHACGVKSELELGYRPLVPLEEGVRRQVRAALARSDRFVVARPRQQEEAGV